MRTRFDFGYSWVWTYGHLPLLGALLAAGLVLHLRGAPVWLPLLVTAHAVWAGAGFLAARFLFRINDPLSLPTRDFLPAGGRVLDIGCGAGRTSIMVAAARPGATLVALDDLSARYIRGHGEAKLRRNLEAAGASDRVGFRRADMREIPFPAASFDGAVSSYAIDHLPPEGARRTLAEVRRVLRPGGDFLLMVVAPNCWTWLSYGPIFSLHGFAGTRRWEEWLARAGFSVAFSGSSRGTRWFLARATQEAPWQDPGSSRTTSCSPPRATSS